MIATRGLSYAYPGGACIDFDDMEVAQGETLVLQGRSGSGKSTWLALAAGLLTPQAGEVLVAGEAPGRLPPRSRDAWRSRSLGFLPQSLYLSEALTVEENLTLPYFAAGLPVDKARVQAVLQDLGLATLARSRPSQLSVGQAQRVALARAVLLAPRVILADEPTASLDDETANDALALLRQCARDHGATLVIATHDPRVQAELGNARLYRLGAQKVRG